MAKFYNNRVKTGRLAGSVFAVRFGETIERAYQPVVANPRTEAQVGCRARMKLMSQLSAVMAPVIAFRRAGAVSPRNLFTKKNYELTSFSDNTASVDLDRIKLTNSVVGLGILNASRGEGSVVDVSVSDAGIDRAVFAAFVKQPDNTLRLSETLVVSQGSGGVFQGTMSLAVTREYVIYAYGVRDNTGAAKAVFGNMETVTAERIAKLITSRTLLESDVTLTETKAITLSVPTTNNSNKKS